MDQTQSLSLLLAKPALRKKLVEDPQGLREELQLDEATLAFLRGLDSGELESQADCLVNKRFHEVRGIIPRTIKGLGEDARRRFRVYAEEEWPAGHRRHLLDAEAFARCCAALGLPGVDPFELNRLGFRLRGWGLRVRFIRSEGLRGRGWRIHFLCHFLGRLVERRW